MITIWGERIAAVFAAVVAIYMMYVAWNFPANGNLFPVFAGAAVICISVLMIVRTIFSPGVFFGKWPRIDVWADIKPLLLTAAVVVYVLLIFRLGYYTSSALFLIVTARVAAYHADGVS